MTANKTTKMAKQSVEIVLKGDTYIMTETALGDFSALRKFIESKRVKLIRDSYPDTEDNNIAGERIAVLSNVIRRGVTQIELDDELGTFDGQIFMLYRAMLPNHPDMTFDKAMVLFSGKESDFKEVSALQEALGVVDEGDSKNA